MHKKNLTILLGALLGASLLVPAISYAEGSYVKLGVGQSRYSSDRSATATAYFLAYGMQIDPSLDLEFGLIDFGRGKAEITFEDQTGSASARTRSLYAAGIGNIPLTPTLNLLGKLGLSVNSSSAVKVSQNLLDQDYSNSDGRTTNLRVLLGTGLSIQFSKEMAGSIEYTYFGTAAHGAKVSLFNAAMRYNF